MSIVVQFSFLLRPATSILISNSCFCTPFIIALWISETSVWLNKTSVGDVNPRRSHFFPVSARRGTSAKDIFYIHGLKRLKFTAIRISTFLNKKQIFASKRHNEKTQFFSSTFVGQLFVFFHICNKMYCLQQFIK